ncbi:MAG: ATP cone domain-containing protein [Candidatus Nanohaloarchaea archaeon]
MIKVLKDDGRKEQLDEGKLWDSLYWPAREAEYAEEEAVELADQAKAKIMSWIGDHEDNVVTTEELRDRAFGILEEIDEDVAFLYEKHLDIN